MNPIEVEMEPHITIDYEMEFYLRIDVEFKPEIIIDYEIDLTNKELAYMYSMVGDKHEQRKNQIAKYYFVLQYSVREIAKFFEISPSMVHLDIQAYRRDVVSRIKKDLRANKKVLNHMVDLMIQTEHRIRTAWEEYQTLDNHARMLNRLIQEENERRRQNPDYKGSSLSELADTVKVLMQTSDKKATFLFVLNKETQMMLNIFDKFGLTGEEAMKLVVSGGIDIELKIREMRELLINVGHIIRHEVTDNNQQKRIFNRMTNVIEKAHLHGRESGFDLELKRQ